MKKHYRLISALLSLAFCISAFSIPAFAEDGDNFQGDPNTGVDSSVQDSNVNPDPGVDQGSDGQQSSVVEEPTYDYQSSESYQESYYDSSTYESSYYESEYSSDYYSESSYDYYEESTYYYYDNSVQSSYTPPISTAPSAAVYDVDDRKIDDNELSSKDWKEIQANLSNASNSDGDAGDFAFIKNNDSKNDNGYWMLILGVTLILLSVAGIIYVIASNVAGRKKATAGGGHSTNGGSNLRYRSSDDYSDGYSRKKGGRSRKYDTADVKLPKSNGRRYK